MINLIFFIFNNNCFIEGIGKVAFHHDSHGTTVRFTLDDRKIRTQTVAAPPNARKSIREREITPFEHPNYDL